MEFDICSPTLWWLSGDGGGFTTKTRCHTRATRARYERTRQGRRQAQPCASALCVARAKMRKRRSWQRSSILLFVVVVSAGFHRCRAGPAMGPVLCCCCPNRFLSLQRGTCYGLVVQHCQCEAAGYGLVVQHCKHDCSASARRTCTAVARSPAHPLFRLVVTFTSLTYYSSKSRQGISRRAREHLTIFITTGARAPTGFPAAIASRHVPSYVLGTRGMVKADVRQVKNRGDMSHDLEKSGLSRSH